jgi:hypothetical protein
LVILSFAWASFAQEKINTNAVRVDNDQPLLEFLSSIESHSAIRFFYMAEWLDPFTVKSTLSGLPLKEVLNTVLQESEISVIFLND